MNNLVRLRTSTYLIAIFVSILPRFTYCKTMNYYQLSKDDPATCLKFKAQCDNYGFVKSTAYKRKIHIDKCHLLSESKIRYRDPSAYKYIYGDYNRHLYKTAENKQELKHYVCKEKKKSSTSVSSYKSTSLSSDLVLTFLEILFEALLGFSDD